MTRIPLGEHFDDREDSMRSMQEGHQAQMWTALPAIIQSFNAAAGTIVAQPVIQAERTSEDGRVSRINLPLLADVPVVFPGGGGATLTFPIAAGDECLIVFASRCIDGWFQLGGIQPALDPRMHSLSDGFAFVGVRSAARALPDLSTTSTQLRNDAGTMKIDFNASSGVIKATCTEFRVTGKIVSETEVEVGAIKLSSHRHTGVEPGSGTTGVPTT